ncbi:MAG: hypothetical protein K0R98_1300 [Rickettsiaceae bacterium]|jgi:uncharacterized phiE125 gp8 family phage protein|nr:hypothetical protein [Rickettsiaceae bacterium]
MTNKPYLELCVAPVAEPLTLSEAKDYLKVTGSGDDTLITNLIKSVRETAEKFMKISLINQSWKISYDQYTPSEVKLLMGPVQTVTSVTAYDRGGEGAVISSDTYYLSSGKQRLIFDVNIVSQHIEIIYLCGYGVSSSYIPSPIKQGMLAHIAAIYDGREGSNTIPAQSKALYGPYKMLRI